MKFYSKVKSQTNLSSIWVSCKHPLTWEIKADTAQTGFCIVFEKLKISPSCVAISNLIKKQFSSSNQITLEHVKHNKSLYQYHGITISNEVYFFVFKIFVVFLFEQIQVTRSTFFPIKLFGNPTYLAQPTFYFNQTQLIQPNPAYNFKI